MILFVDASAMVAMLAGEPDREELVKRLGACSRPLASPMSCWETVSALQNSFGRPIKTARAELNAFIAHFSMELVSIGERELTMALDAYETYGKGRHRAKLNFGDCFAYACAKANGARLLYKGSDFTHTDLA